MVYFRKGKNTMVTYECLQQSWSTAEERWPEWVNSTANLFVITSSIQWMLLKHPLDLDNSFFICKYAENQTWAKVISVLFPVSNV